MSAETILLKIAGDSSGGEAALRRVGRALDDLGGALRSAQAQTKGSTDGLNKIKTAAKGAGDSSAAAKGGLGGMLGMLTKINPAAIAAGLGLAGVVKVVKALKNAIVPVVGDAQSLQISLESLAARELVKAGQFDNASDAMATAEVAAQGLLRQIQQLGLVSPYENSVVVETFRLGMAYNFAADEALKLTRANLQVSSGLSLTAQDITEINRVFGQIRSTGKLLTQDLNQLRGRGIDLAGILTEQLGVSVADFNAGLQDGTYTMNDLLDAFAEFADVNFADAGARMTKTLAGMKSTFQDLKEIAITQLFKPAADRFTAVGGEALGQLTDLVVQSGALERGGQKLAEWADRAINLGRGVVNFFRQARQSADEALSSAGRFVGIFSLGNAGKAIWQEELAGIRQTVASLRSIGSLVWNFVAPAFQWLYRIVTESDITPFVAQWRDYIHVVFSLINGLLLSIRNLLQGQGFDSFAPMNDALVNVLTWVAVTWDRFVSGALSWGWNLVVQIANGIYNAARSVLTGALTYLGNFIGLFLKPGSPPKKGPLSHIVEWGRGVINTFLQSFKTGDFRAMQESLSPIKAALQDAVSVGNIDEPEFVQVYGQARDAVAELWATFRETGEISEEVLARIGGALGEGSEEIVSYLRYQLRYQQALDNLAAVQKDVAAAEEAGFVPAHLKEQLEAAEAEAAAAQDQVDWQKEFLNVQQESVDLQLQLVKALDKVAGAMEKVSAATSGLKGGAGITAPELPFTSGLGELGNLGSIFEGGDDLKETLGGISTEFETMRERVQAWLDAPIEGKIHGILEELSAITGIDLTEIYDNLRELDLRETFEWLIEGGVEVLRTNGPRWARDIGSGLISVILRGLVQLRLARNRWRSHIAGVLSDLIRDFITTVQTNGPTWARNLGAGFGTVIGGIFTFFTETLPEWQRKMAALPLALFTAIVEWMTTNAPTHINEFVRYGPQALFAAAIEWIRTNAPGKVGDFVQAVQDFIGQWVETVKTEGPGWASGLVEFGEELLAEFVEGFLENAPEGLKDVVESGAEFVAKIREGVDDAWDLLEYAQEKVETWVGNILTDGGTWMTRLPEIGKTFLAKIRDGINREWNLRSWIGAKFSALVSSLTTDAPTFLSGLWSVGSTLVQKIKDGVSAAWQDFPGWLSGLFSEAWTSLTSGVNSGWSDTVYNAGGAIVEMLKQGILDVWTSFISWLRQKLEGIIDYLPGSEPKAADSPLRGLSKRGAALVRNFASGIDFGVVQRQLRAELSGVQRMLASASPVGGAGISVFVDGGMSFPGVRTGRDADRFKDALKRQSLVAAM